MRQRRHWALIVSFLLLVGQATLPMAASSCPCKAAVGSAAGHACCCGHPPGEACPCSPHDGGGGPNATKPSGACALDAAGAAASLALELPPPSATAAPSLALTLSAIAMPRLAAVHAATHDPPRVVGSVIALRSIVLRN